MLALLLLFPLAVTAQEAGDDLRIMGVLELRTQNDVAAPVAFCSLNHEGGMKVRVLEVVCRGTRDGTDGSWLWVLLTSPMWVDSGELLAKYTKLLIFLPDDMPVQRLQK